MITALDSSVLFSISKQQAGVERWMAALVQARREGRLVICEVVYAEVSCDFSTKAEFDAFLLSLGISLDSIGAEAAFLAGKTRLAYRRAGGPREHMIPDFLVAAHAKTQADRLAATDRGYLRRYFSTLPLLQPDEAG